MDLNFPIMFRAAESWHTYLRNDTLRKQNVLTRSTVLLGILVHRCPATAEHALGECGADTTSFPLDDVNTKYHSASQRTINHCYLNRWYLIEARSCHEPMGEYAWYSVISTAIGYTGKVVSGMCLDL